MHWGAANRCSLHPSRFFGLDVQSGYSSWKQPQGVPGVTA